tara:strand:- start:138 stop:461 length:324 start_codon:yes stop_codon:yes gene_type:complete
MEIFKFIFYIFFLLVVNFSFENCNSQINDHEKAIEAVKSGEILPLDQILLNIRNQFDGRVLAINLKDSEQGLFGWVYDIRMINSYNEVINLRVDAGTSTVLMVEGAD